MDPGVIIKLHVEPEEQPAALTVCPLCCSRFEAALEESKATCPGCGLKFTPAPPEPEIDAAALATSQVAESLPADPLDRWLQGAPLVPREVTEAEWLRNWARRHWLATSALGLAAVALSLTALASSAAWLRVSVQLKQAVVAREESDALRQDAESAKADSDRELEHRLALWKSEQTLRRRLERRLDAARATAETSERQLREAQSARQQAEREARRAIAEHLATRSEQVRAEHPEHSLLLAAEALTLTQRDGEAPIPSAAQYLRDRLGAEDGQPLRGHGGKITALAISPKSRWLATASVDNTARLWDLKSDEVATRPLILAGHHGRVSAAAFSPDDRWIATGSYDSSICLWNLAATDPAADPLVLPGHDGRITNLAISPNARWLLAASSGYNRGDSELRVWDLAAAEPPEASRALPGHGDRVQNIAISRDGRWVATTADDGVVRLCALTPEGPAVDILVLQGHRGRLSLPAFSADGRWLVAAESGGPPGPGGCWLWDLQAAQPAKKPIHLAAPVQAIRALAGSLDGRWLVAGAEDGGIYVWDLTAPSNDQQGVALRGHRGAVLAACFSADQRWLATAGSDQNICLWSLATMSSNATPVVLHANQGAIDSLAISRDGRWLVSAGEDNAARLWNLRLDGLITLALRSFLPGETATVTIEEAPKTQSMNTAARSLHLADPQREIKLQR